MIQGMASLVYGRAILLFGQILIVPILVVRWGAAGYGEWVALSALASYLTYTHLGVAGALRADMAAAFSQDDHQRMAEGFQTSLCLIAGFTIFAGAMFLIGAWIVPLDGWLKVEFMSTREATMVASAFAVQTILLVFGAVVNAGLSSVGRYGLANFLDANRQMVEFAAIFAIVAVGKGRPIVACAVYPITGILYIVALFICIMRHAPWLLRTPWLPQRRVLARLFKPMLGIMGMSFGYYGMSIQAPRIILASTWGPASVAVLAIAMMLVRTVRLPIDIPAHSSTVEMSLAYGRGDMDAARRLVGATSSFSLWTTLVLVPGLTLLGPTVVKIWTNGRIAMPIPLLALLSVSTVIYSLTLPSQEALTALNKLSKASIWLLVTSAPFLALVYFMTKQFALSGVGASLIALDALYGGLAVFWMLRYFDYRPSAFVSDLLHPPLGTFAAEFNRVKGYLAKLRGGAPSR